MQDPRVEDGVVEDDLRMVRVELDRASEERAMFGGRQGSWVPETDHARGQQHLAGKERSTLSS